MQQSGMRQIASLLLPLLALLAQPAAAQAIDYDFGFEEAAPEPAPAADGETTQAFEAAVEAGSTPEAPAPVEAPAAEDGGRERVVAIAEAQAQEPQRGEVYGPFRVVDDSRAAMTGITNGASVDDFEAMLREHPGIATLELIDCPGTEDDRANLRLGRLIRSKGIATHVPANGFVASGAVELYLAGVRRSAEPGAEFAVHAWEDDSGREPSDYAPDAPQNRAYLDYYRTMGMSDDAARSFYAMTNSAPFAKARWLTAGDMDRWTRFDDTAQAPAAAPEYTRVTAAVPVRVAAAQKPRAAYGPFRILDDSRAAMVGVTDGSTPAAFNAMLRDHPGIATLELVDCPGTEDDRANLRLGRLIRARGIATHVPANGWVASGAVELFLAGTQRSAEPSARFAVHSWEDDSGRGPKDYSPNAPKNRAYLDYYRTMGMNESEARAFYAMTNSTPFSRPRALTTADMAQWARLARPLAGPRTTLAQAAGRRPQLAAF